VLHSQQRLVGWYNVCYSIIPSSNNTRFFRSKIFRQPCELIAKNDCRAPILFSPQQYQKQRYRRCYCLYYQNRHYFFLYLWHGVCERESRLFRNVVQRKNALFLLIHFMDMIPRARAALCFSTPGLAIKCALSLL
jgi:hypothetical protein